MDQPTCISRVIVVVLDGLRPDAISTFHLHHIQRLMHAGAFTMHATTVSPSITAAAMTSLLTGVHPETHGLRSDRLHIPSAHKQLFPVPRVLHDAGIATFAFMQELPLLSRPFAHHIARKLGVQRIVFRGKTAPSILMEARHTLQTEPRGFFLLHWTDADQAGHQFGWMSNEYREAAKKLDASLGLLCALTNLVNDPSTLLIALADHGGGGEVPTNHESSHPHDLTIPILLCGGSVTRSRLDADVSLLDVSPTILHALDVAIPSNYAGRPLTEAFTPAFTPAFTTPAYAIAS